jgi:hypothetical protein
MRRILLAFVMTCVVLLAGCKTVEPVVQQRIVVPDLSAYRIDAYELFPLIAEPKTDADLMYNSLVLELAGALEGAYADMLESQLDGVRETLTE